MNTLTVDLLVIGGGINGTAIAADAAGRGLSVILCESEDLASATSSASSKLIHGGLRYLEQYEFKLVREALKERAVLLKKYPHLVHALTFVLPHDKHLRPKWMIRLGLFLYDHLSGSRILAKSQKVNLTNSSYGEALQPTFTSGFTYSDSRTDDARLVVLNALSAQSHGAKILTRTTCINTERKADVWHATLQSKQGTNPVKARALVNAAGPWVDKVLHDVIDTKSTFHVHLVKGSHLVVPKLYEGNHAYILQHTDKRIIFTIPYGYTDHENYQYTLIGTTDQDYQGDLRDIEISNQEIDYLCQVVDYYFAKAVDKSSILWSYAGVRPLYDDNADNPSKITREYHLELEDWQGQTPLLSVFGGKITTHRTLAEHAMEKLKPFFPKMGKGLDRDSSYTGRQH